MYSILTTTMVDAEPVEMSDGCGRSKNEGGAWPNGMRGRGPRRGLTASTILESKLDCSTAASGVKSDVEPRRRLTAAMSWLERLSLGNLMAPGQ